MEARKAIAGFIVVAMMVALIVSRYADAEIVSPPSQKGAERQPIPCDDPKGSGARFYDFDRIVIYYATSPFHFEKRPGYADELKYERFNKRLTDAIKKNFTLCLTNAFGEEKPIYTLVSNSRPNGLTQEEFDKIQELAYDARTLTIMVSLRYNPNRRKSLDVDVEGKENIPAWATVAWVMHRTGLQDLESLPLMGNRFELVTLFPEQRDVFMMQLEHLWDRLRPHKDYPPPHGSVFHVIGPKKNKGKE